MITSATIHALERLTQRRGCVHLIGHLRKVRATSAAENWGNGKIDPVDLIGRRIKNAEG